MLERLAGAAARRQSELAGELPVTRQAVAKHLATLEQAGLVSGERDGRDTGYRLDPRRSGRGRLARARRREWDARLAALARHVERRQA